MKKQLHNLRYRFSILTAVVCLLLISISQTASATGPNSGTTIKTKTPHEGVRKGATQAEFNFTAEPGINAPNGSLNIDTDGDGIPNSLDADDDNDGITDVNECNQSNFFWSNPPSVSGNTATGFINGIAYTYTSSQNISTTSYMFANSVFPSSYGVPNANPTIANIYVTSNTLTFASPMTNPVLVFASIGQPNVYVPITFSSPIQVVWSQNVVVNSSTQITGNEGYAIIRMMGTFTSISFNYLAQENWCNFAFGADFQSCPDTDNDGITDNLDTDSDNDGCPDALEGSGSFTMAQISSGQLTGSVASNGIPMLAGSGQGIGNSKIAAANCFCQPGNDNVNPTITAPANIIMNIPSCQSGNVNVALGTPTASDNCSVTVTNNAPASFGVGTTNVIWTAKDPEGNSATATQTVTITQSAGLTLTSTKDINCSGPNSGSITANAGGGRAPLQYQLNSGAYQSSNTFTNLAPGVYSLTVKDADNCTATQNQISLVEPFCLQAKNDSFSNCAGQPITILKSTLLGNDANPWNVSIYMDVAQPANGTVVDNGTSITYTPNANFTGIETFNYTIKKNDGAIAFAGNGHVYEWVPALGITWNSAKIGSSLRFYNGMQGYLVTVTSAQEMTFVSSKLQGSGWMGASDRAYEGTWRWVTGPEGLEDGGQGRHFSNQFKSPFGNCGASTAPALLGLYANWAGNEPNDCGAYLNQYVATDQNRGGEHYAHFYGQGIWNDYPDNVGTSIQGYIVEYGGLEGPLASAGTSTASIVIDNKRVMIAETITNETCTGASNGSITLNVSGGTAPYTYNWGGGITSANRTGLTAGNYTVTVTDAKGCNATKNITILMVDNIPPVAKAKNITVSLNASGNVSITAAQVDNGSGDACGIASMTVTPNTFNCAQVGNHIVTLTVKDNSNNTASTSSIVTVVDNMAPNAIAQNVIINLDASGNAGLTAAQVNYGSNDNCGIASVAIDKTSFTCSDEGNNTVTLTVTDVHGNMSTATANVQVVDAIGPNVVTQNVIAYLDASGSATITPAQVNNGSSDNCGIASMSLDKSTFGCNNVSTANSGVLSARMTADNLYTVYISTNDNTQGTAFGSGNNWGQVYSHSTNLVAGQTYYLHVLANDVGGPEMMIGDFTVTGDFKFTNGSQTMSTSAANWKVSSTGWSGYGSAIDVGGNGISPWGFLSGISSGARYIWRSPWNTSGNDVAYFTTPVIYTGGATTVVLTVTDVNGNSTSGTANVTVLDNIPPTLNCPSNIHVYATSAAGATVNYTAPVGTDNCAVTTSRIAGPASGSTFPIGITTVTYKAIDASGLSATCSFTVEVTGIPPVIVCPSNITVSNTAGQCGAMVNYTATETTAIPASTISYSIAPGSNFNVGTTTVTATATNPVGSSSCTFTVTVNDNEVPAVLTQNMTIALDAGGAASITAGQINNGSSDNCGIASIALDKSSFDCSNVGANTVTLTVTDIHGNSASATALVIVNDVTPPVVVTQNIGVTLANGSATITAAQIDNGSSDACGIASMTVSPSSFNCSDIGNNTVTLTVTDVNGHVSTGTAVVAVNGVIPSCSVTSAPNNSGTVIGHTNTLAGVNQMYLGYGAQSMNLSCTATGGAPFTYSWTGSGLSSSTVANPVFTPTAGGNYTFVCTVTNAYGCQTTCKITICVLDIRASGGSPNNPKVLLCHVPPGNPNNTQTLSISINAVQPHLTLHGGDKLGSCAMTCGYAKSDQIGEIYSEETPEGEIDLIVYPNPSSTHFTFQLESQSEEPMQFVLYDMSGRMIDQQSNLSPKEALVIGDQLSTGMYTAVITQGSFSKSVKVTKIR